MNLRDMVFCIALIMLPVIGESAEIPAGVPGLLADNLQTARHDWAEDAQLVHAKFNRENADKPFDSSIAFLSPSRQKIYYIKNGKGKEEDYNRLPALTTKVIDLPQAIEAARKSGMQGEVLSAQLMTWASYGGDTVVEVWRLIPDNDPASDDRNDHTMKNYFIDALTGTAYASADADPKAMAQGHDAMEKALRAGQ